MSWLREKPCPWWFINQNTLKLTNVAELQIFNNPMDKKKKQASTVVVLGMS